MPGFRLTTKQSRVVRKKTKIHDLDPSEAGGELNIVPFLDIVTNLILFILATSAAVMSVAQLDAQLPISGRPRPGAGVVDAPALNLSVTITDSGIIVAGSGGKLAPGCSTTATGRVITVPRTNRRLPTGAIESYDWTALTACVAQVKTQFPDERQVILGADPQIEYEQVVHAMDSLRSQGGNELFPEVMFSVGVR